METQGHGAFSSATAMLHSSSSGKLEFVLPPVAQAEAQREFLWTSGRSGLLAGQAACHWRDAEWSVLARPTARKRSRLKSQRTLLQDQTMCHRSKMRRHSSEACLAAGVDIELFLTCKLTFLSRFFCQGSSCSRGLQTKSLGRWLAGPWGPKLWTRQTHHPSSCHLASQQESATEQAHGLCTKPASAPLEAQSVAVPHRASPATCSGVQ